MGLCPGTMVGRGATEEEAVSEDRILVAELFIISGFTIMMAVLDVVAVDDGTDALD